MEEEQGRPVKPHRSGGGLPQQSIEAAIAATPLPNYLQPEKPRCAVRGLVQPLRGNGRGVMCGSVIVGGEFCGHADECRYKVTSNLNSTTP